MSILLWVFAFLGVALIYGGSKLVRIISNSDNNSKTDTLIKVVGVLVSAASLIALYITGSFK